jgi:hypothetical protein
MVAQRLERVAWPAAVLTWAYLIFHAAHELGQDFSSIYSGPHGMIHGAAIYPTTDDPASYFAHSVPYYVHPPGAPVALSWLAPFPESAAGAIFIVVSAAVFLVGLYRLARQTPVPALIVLAAGLSLPVRDEIGLGNADLLCAGLIALSITTALRYRAIPLGLAIAIKPTVWPVLALFGMDALLALGLAAALTAIGLVAIHDVGRFFHNVIPYLAHGQVAVDTVRTSLTDLGVAAGLPRTALTVPCAIALVALALFVLWRTPPAKRLALAPLLVLASLLLSSYSYVPYVVYLIAVLPLLRPADTQLWLLGIGLYLIGASDVWATDALPHQLNTLLNFRVFFGMALLIPIAARPLLSAPRLRSLDRRRMAAPA